MDNNKEESLLSKIVGVFIVFVVLFAIASIPIKWYGSASTKTSVAEEELHKVIIEEWENLFEGNEAPKTLKYVDIFGDRMKVKAVMYNREVKNFEYEGDGLKEIYPYQSKLGGAELISGFLSLLVIMTVVLSIVCFSYVGANTFSSDDEEDSPSSSD